MKIFRVIREKLFWLSYVAAAIPFISAFIGYRVVGKLGFWETVYASIALYFVNPVVDIENGYVVFAEITSTIVVAGIILSVVRYASRRVGHMFVRLHKDATVVYTDNDWGKELLRTIRHGYIVDSTERAERVNNHILMFSDDLNNINFYTKHEKKLKDKNVYMLMQQVDSTLLEAADDEEAALHFFNIYDLLARTYWKDNNLYDKRKEAVKIAIIGYDQVGIAIFKYGFLNNIFSLDQNFEYHIWGCDEFEKTFVKRLSTMNKDKIIVHDGNWDEEIDSIKEMDRIIYTLKEHTVEALQRMLYINPDAEVHCYSESMTDFSDLYLSDKILTFGDIKDVLTEENVKEEKLYQLGKLFNYDYCLRYAGRTAPEDFKQEMEDEWKKLSGFYMDSNVARADHFWIEQRLFEDGELSEDSEIAWELEHIRWCRFYFINHWTYNEVRNNAKRQHPMLVAYDKLPKSEKAKDGIYDERIKKEMLRLLSTNGKM
ncbi:MULTISPECIES: RyR domain-containing protein [unclassified Butyrivibrio]|uniref:RyR domain-containing protein n=1 Tax=unclassified Butyrivibrio TaxID=2639466 RepID=UPI0003B392DE|nr:MULTISPECIES: RyR domain-containing protein [unclassified Butyrivibrio]MDC7292210.1 RyR domain-containing protein [Butyrivibrio sp. DSM 10294]